MERKTDGTLRQSTSLGEDGWLREDGPEVRLAVMEKADELGRPLTDEEKEEVARSVTTGE